MSFFQQRRKYHFSVSMPTQITVAGQVVVGFAVNNLSGSRLTTITVRYVLFDDAKFDTDALLKEPPDINKNRPEFMTTLSAEKMDINECIPFLITIPRPLQNKDLSFRVDEVMGKVAGRDFKDSFRDMLPFPLLPVLYGDRE